MSIKGKEWKKYNEVTENNVTATAYRAETEIYGRGGVEKNTPPAQPQVESDLPQPGKERSEYQQLQE